MWRPFGNKNERVGIGLLPIRDLIFKFWFKFWNFFTSFDSENCPRFHKKLSKNPGGNRTGAAWKNVYATVLWYTDPINVPFKVSTFMTKNFLNSFAGILIDILGSNGAFFPPKNHIIILHEITTKRRLRVHKRQHAKKEPWKRSDENVFANAFSAVRHRPQPVLFNVSWARDHPFKSPSFPVLLRSFLCPWYISPEGQRHAIFSSLDTRAE